MVLELTSRTIEKERKI